MPTKALRNLLKPSPEILSLAPSLVYFPPLRGQIDSRLSDIPGAGREREREREAAVAPRSQQAISQFFSLTLSSSLCYFTPLRPPPGEIEFSPRWSAGEGQSRVQPLYRRVLEEFSESLLPWEVSLRSLELVSLVRVRVTRTREESFLPSLSLSSERTCSKIKYCLEWSEISARGEILPRSLKSLTGARRRC